MGGSDLTPLSSIFILNFTLLLTLTLIPPAVLARVLVGAFKPVYWQALIVVAALYFARFDASFLSLR